MEPQVPTARIPCEPDSGVEVVIVARPFTGNAVPSARGAAPSTRATGIHGCSEATNPKLAFVRHSVMPDEHMIHIFAIDK